MALQVMGRYPLQAQGLIRGIRAPWLRTVVNVRPDFKLSLNLRHGEFEKILILAVFAYVASHLSLPLLYHVN